MADLRSRMAWFSFRGRAGRREYWKVLGLTLVVGWTLSLVATVPAAQVVAVPLSLAINIVQWAVLARRLHDLGRSGWWQLPATVLGIAAALRVVTLGPSGIETQPGLAAAMMGAMGLYFAFVVAIGSVKGSTGPNRYGPPPA